MLHVRHSRQIALRACELLRIDRWWKWLDDWNGLITLNYHRFGDRNACTCDQGVFSVTAEQFDKQLRILKKNCDLISLSDVGDIIRPGNTRRAVLLTIDDGYRDNYEIAYPILRTHDVSATIFLATGFIDRPQVAWWDEISWIIRQASHQVIQLPERWHVEPFDVERLGASQVISRVLRIVKSLTPTELQEMLQDLAECSGVGRAPVTSETAPWMTWDMIREMHQNGIHFGGHTITHPVLSYCPIDQQRQEIAGSKQRIEQELGSEVTAFSYPVGLQTSFTQQTIQIVRQAGYHWGFGFYSGYSTYPTNDFDLKRVAIHPGMRDSEFRMLVSIPRLFAR